VPPLVAVLNSDALLSRSAAPPVTFKNEDEAVNARVRDQLLVVRNAAEQLRAALLATAEDPAEPHLARAAHDEQVEAARAQLARLVRWCRRRKEH
jgi:hypothetical protein